MQENEGKMLMVGKNIPEIAFGLTKGTNQPAVVSSTVR